MARGQAISNQAKRPERTTTIISAWPKPGFSWRLPSGDYTMPANEPCKAHSVAPCATCKQVALYPVSKRHESSDIGDDRHIVFPVDDLELATDLVSASKQYGCTIIEGDVPTMEEREAAYEAMEEYLRMTLAQEDEIWSSRKMHLNPDHARIAMQYFNVQRSWSEDTQPKEPCPSCRTFNPLGSARCANPACGAVLDWEKAREFGVLTDAQIKYGLAMGKLQRIPGVDDDEPPKKKGA